MPGWQELSQQLQQAVNSVIYFAKSRKREEATIGFAAILFWLGYSSSKWLSPELKDWVSSWHGLLIIPGVFYSFGVVFLCYALYRIWQLAYTPKLPPPKDRPSAIKGPLAFAPADGELFRRLGREDELGKLLGFIEDDQVRMVVLMGASGVGKTSLLRAGLTNILRSKSIAYHYWEALPTSPGPRLLRAIQESWSGAAQGGTSASNPPTLGKPESLEDLVNPPSTMLGGRHVIVLDQFEQLHGISTSNPILRLLRKVAREAKPPHRVTWIVAFRREFRAEWEDFTLPEKERGVYPSEISLRLFTAEQAHDVISQLIAEAQLSIQQKVVDNLVAAATVDGEVSPVDIGIGLQVLAELHDRRGGKTVTLDDYHFAGGAEGLLTQYISRCLDIFPDADRQTILKAMLALREPGTNQRIAEGRTCAELAKETKADPGRIKTQFERLTQRDIRLLETISSAEESVTRFRLPHERFIPALNRMAGQLLADVDQARLKFENAFMAWTNSEKSARYLLRAGELRLVERYEAQIPWGRDSSEKSAFLRYSQRRRTLRRLVLGALLIFLPTAGWLGTSQYQRYDARTSLRDSNYPPDLYEWQNQLKTLRMAEPINVQRFPWLHSDTLEELNISVAPTANSLDSLVASLARCRALKKLTLNIASSEVSDLTPLRNLTGLTQLDLVIADTDVSDLTPLARLTALNRLNLDASGSNVRDLSPLAELTALTQLGLNISGSSSVGSAVNIGYSKVDDLMPLTKLTALTRLTVRLGLSDVTNLTPLTQLPALTELNLDLSRSGVSDFTPLTKLPALTQLNLDLSLTDVANLSLLTRLTAITQLNLDIQDSNVSDLSPLEKLTGLTQLNLNIAFSAISDLTALTKLPALTQLTLSVSKSRVTELSALAKLTALTRLNIDLSDSKVQDLSPLTKLHGLTQLTLNLNSSHVRDLSSLTNLPALTQLDIEIGDGPVSELSPLAKLNALSQLNLNISGSKVSDLSPLAKLTALTQVNLDLRTSKVSDLWPLSKLSGLAQLTLKISDRDVSDLASLSQLTKLKEFTLDISRGEMMVDLTQLAKLTTLTHLALDFGYNRIRDLAPLTELTGLTQLDLDISNSQGPLDLTPLTKLYSCRTFMLKANTEQRLSLRGIPRSVTHLEF